MSKISVAPAWAVNENGEIVATSGSGSDNVKGYIHGNHLPMLDGKLAIAGLPKITTDLPGNKVLEDAAGNQTRFGQSTLRNVGTPLWQGAPSASMFTISAQTGSVTTQTTSDGGLLVTGSSAGAYVDLVMTLPFPIAVKSAMIEVKNDVNQNLISAYFAQTSAFNASTMINRSLNVGMSGSSSETHRTGARNHLWFTNTTSSAWTNSGSLDLDQTLFSYFRIRISPQAGQIASATIYSASINPVGRSRLAVISDDGYLTWLKYAVPILQRRGIPSTIGVIPSLVGTNVNYCTLQQLKDFVASGNECVAHGPVGGNGNLIDNYATNDQRIADIAGTLEYLKTNKLAGKQQLKCYVFPEGRFTTAQGDTTLLDAMSKLGITFGRTVTRQLAFSSDAIKTNSYSAMTVPIIGYIRQSTESADQTEYNNVLANIDYCAQNGLDGIIMLHNVIPAQTYGSNWAATTSTDITINNLVGIADALVASRKNYGAELVAFSKFAP